MGRIFAGAVLLLGVLIGPVFSATVREVTLVKTADPVRHSYPGVDLAVDGVELGMSPQEAKARIEAAQKARSKITEASKPIGNDDGSLTSQAYVSRLSAELSADRSIIVQFGTPATGTPAISVEQTTDFRSGGEPPPTIEQLLKNLDAKFGKESSTTRMTHDHFVYGMWLFDAKSVVSCDAPNNGCEVASPSLNPSGLHRAEASLGRGYQVIVTAMVSFAESNPSVVKSYTVTIEDITNKVSTLTEMNKQFETAAHSPR